MNISLSFSPATEVQAPCLAVPLWSGGELSDLARQIDEQMGGLVSSVLSEDGWKPSVGATKLLYAPGASVPRVLLLGLGTREKFSGVKWSHAVAKGARAVRSIKRTSFALALPELPLEPSQIAQGVAEGAMLGLQTFAEFKTDEESRGKTVVEALTLVAQDESQRAELESGLEKGRARAKASIRARRWVDLPPNKKSPRFLALEAQKVAEETGLRCEVWDESRLREEKMDALLAVGMGSDEAPRFIILEHAPQGRQDDAPLILVGKGMTFDSGGYSLKPPTSMEDMKDDMAGAAVVLATMEAVGKAKPDQRVIGLIPTAENMISGRAQRPGDIVTARSGLTIEVLNTDAEGRLILADALSYACELKPRAIIDLATLTGAIRIALGTEAAGLFSNDDALAAQVFEAGERVGERVWRFPLWDEYKDYMKGPYSDLKNIGPERNAGSIAAAIFLEKFVTEGTPWAHLDIAAVSLLREEKPLSTRGATGFGVRLLLDWLENQD
jgi:leucyl aminopeptidase